MQEINIFEEHIRKIKEIERIADDHKRDVEYENFYDSLNPWEYELLINYKRAKEQNNAYVDIATCPLIEEIPDFISALKKFGITRFTISLEWSKLTEKIWYFCQNGCKLEGMTEINGRARNEKTKEYFTEPAFLLSVEENKKDVLSHIMLMELEEFIGFHGFEKVMLFNKEKVTEEEALCLVKAGEYNENILVLSRKQWFSLFKNEKASENEEI